MSLGTSSERPRERVLPRPPVDESAIDYEVSQARQQVSGGGGGGGGRRLPEIPPNTGNHTAPVMSSVRRRESERVDNHHLQHSLSIGASTAVNNHNRRPAAAGGRSQNIPDRDYHYEWAEWLPQEFLHARKRKRIFSFFSFRIFLFRCAPQHFDCFFFFFSIFG